MLLEVVEVILEVFELLLATCFTKALQVFLVLPLVFPWFVFGFSWMTESAFRRLGVALSSHWDNNTKYYHLGRQAQTRLG